jgi:hypothetical protein
MRLTGEQIKDIRGGGDYRLGELLDTIEAQQEELDSLQKCYDTTNKSWKEQRQEIDRLKAQNKLLYEALMCLPGAMGATVTQEVCRICLRKGECEECLLDRAIREAMER